MKSLLMINFNCFAVNSAYIIEYIHTYKPKYINACIHTLLHVHTCPLSISSNQISAILSCLDMTINAKFTSLDKIV